MPHHIGKAKVKSGEEPSFSYLRSVFRRWGRCLGLLIASLCLVWFFAIPAQSQTRLMWEDLQPSATTLQDPYAHLSIEQTAELSTLAALTIWVEENQVGPDSLESQEIARLTQKFQDQNLDVIALLSQVDQAQAYWQQQSQTTNPEWTGQTVQLSGYVLPLAWNQAEEITEFLLVPYVGACIHVPPPPPNQMIYVQPPQALTEAGLFIPVDVEGQLRSQPATYDLFLVDGSRSVQASYALSLTHLTRSETPADLTIAPTVGPSVGPWWQRLQTQASAVLTQTVGTVHRQRSPSTLLWGLLIAFSYGVLHTLGPGHGKAVIVAYFVGEGGSLQRGLTMGIRIAIFHVLSAIGIVVLTTLVLRQSAPDSYRVLQLVSYGAVSIIGGWMLWRALPWHHAKHSNQVQSYLSAKEAELVLYPDLTRQVVTPSETAPAKVSECGCFSCVEPRRVSDWLSLAIGSVPCSGALLILLYGAANRLLWLSIAMVMAISVGMALTLSCIGILALMGRNYADQQTDHRARTWRRWLKIAGSSSVLLLGVCLLGVTLVSGS